MSKATMEDAYLTTGELKAALEDLPDDIPVRYQRIEDIYFEENGWEGKDLIFNPEMPGSGSTSEYIRAFSAFKHPDEDVFVINAHY